MATQDECYPTIGYDVSARVKKAKEGWHWKVKVHILGMDDKAERTSNGFNSKQDCTEDLMAQFTMVVNDLLSDF